MNRKRILGITALLAVIAMGLTLTACPPDTEERSVTFVNELKNCTIDISIKGGPRVFLQGLTEINGTPDEQTVTKKGEDIVIMTITFGNSQVENAPTTYVILEGNLVAGQQKRGKDAQGVALSYGTLRFKADQNAAGSPVTFKISAIPQDE